MADIVLTTLGPRSMLKMLLDPMGGIVLSNDGHAILREIEVTTFLSIYIHFIFNLFRSLILPQNPCWKFPEPRMKKSEMEPQVSLFWQEK